VQAQSPPPVHYLSDQELTSEKIIDILKPQTYRGIAPVAESQPASGKPDCAAFRQRSRDAASTSDAVGMNVLFAFNSSQISPAAAENLNKLRVALKANELAPFCFRIEGHADNIGSDEYNLVLSQKRAESVVRYLAGEGIEQERLLPVGYGESRPLVNNDTEENRQKNRRVQIAILGSGQEAK
jgi:outer membrane protein OmpA-like peptidoglycan-associated protein